jgi:transposase InsO family protein
MERLKSIVPVEFLSEFLNVSRCGFYNWLKLKFLKTKSQKDELKNKIKEIFDLSKQTYGSPRIYQELKSKGIDVSVNTVALYMSEMGLDARLKKKFRVITTNSNHSYKIAPRLFKTEDLSTMPTGPYQILAGDVTYLRLGFRHYYLAVVIDLYNREVVGWSMKDHMKSDLVIDALKASFLNWDKNTKIIFHSDRGVQYASNAFRDLIKKSEVLPSMSRRGNCYDNAYVESFFATLKKEKICRSKYNTEDQLRQIVFEYIETWYNNNRRHSSLGYVSPRQFKLNNC